MTRAEWRTEILVTLLRKGKTVTQMAKDLGVSRNWIYRVFAEDVGEAASAEWIKRINEYCGIEGEPDENY